MKRLPGVLALATGVIASVAACTSAGGEDPAPGPNATPQVHSAWSRPADSAAVGVAYFVLVNGDSAALTLTGAHSPVSRATEVHESMQHEGMAHMQPRASVEVAARDSVVFAAGGLHVMLIDLQRALVPGDTIPLTLRFGRGDSLVVPVAVRSATGLP